MIGSLHVDAVLAFDQGDAFLRSPGEPHPVRVAFLQHGNVEAGSQSAAEDRVPRMLDPPVGRARLACCRLIDRDCGAGKGSHKEHRQDRFHTYRASFLRFTSDSCGIFQPSASTNGSSPVTDQKRRGGPLGYDLPEVHV